MMLSSDMQMMKGKGAAGPNEKDELHRITTHCRSSDPKEGWKLKRQTTTHESVTREDNRLLDGRWVTKRAERGARKAT